MERMILAPAPLCAGGESGSTPQFGVSSLETHTSCQGDTQTPQGEPCHSTKRKPHNIDTSSNDTTVTNPKRKCISSSSDSESIVDQFTAATLPTEQCTSVPVSFTESMASLSSAACHFASLFNPAAASSFCGGNTSTCTSNIVADCLPEDYAAMSNCIRAVVETLADQSGLVDIERGKAFVKLLMEMLKMCNRLTSSSEFCVLIMQTLRSICTANCIFSFTSLFINNTNN